MLSRAHLASRAAERARRLRLLITTLFIEKPAGVNRRRPREKPPGRDTERPSLRLPALAGSEAAGLIGERQEGSIYGESFASSASI